MTPSLFCISLPLSTFNDTKFSSAQREIKSTHSRLFKTSSHAADQSDNNFTAIRVKQHKKSENFRLFLESEQSPLIVND